MSKLKLYLYLGLALLFITTLGYAQLEKSKAKRLQQELIIAQNNYEALTQENSSLKKSNREFSLTTEQLNYTQDSLIKEMNKVRKELKIKDKEIQRLGYLTSTAAKADTIYFRDTLFRENVKIDTTISDSPWYKCELSLEFPCKFTVKPEFKSEKYLITSTHKETLRPRKRCFIARLFQKKVVVVETEVIEKNPYISNNKERFINIVQ